MRFPISLGILTLCLSPLGHSAGLEPVIDLGRGFETPHLKFVGTVTNSVGKSFQVVAMRKSCECLGDVRVLNADRTIGEDAAITLYLDLNTMNKEGQQEHFLFLLGKSGKEDTVMPVRLTAYVLPILEIQKDLWAMKSFAQFAPTSQQYEIRTVLNEPVEISHGDGTILYTLGQTAPRRYLLKTQFNTERCGIYHDRLQISCGEVTKSFLISYDVRHPLCNKSALLGGLVPVGSEQVIEFTVLHTSPEHVGCATFDNPNLVRRLLKAACSNGTLVRFYFKSEKPGKLIGRFKLQLDSAKYPIIDLGFSAFFAG